MRTRSTLPSSDCQTPQWPHGRRELTFLRSTRSSGITRIRREFDSPPAATYNQSYRMPLGFPGSSARHHHNFKETALSLSKSCLRPLDVSGPAFVQEAVSTPVGHHPCRRHEQTGDVPESDPLPIRGLYHFLLGYEHYCE